MNEIDTKTILETVEILNGVKSLFATSNPLLPVYSALGGAFVGAVSGIIPITISNMLKNSKKKKSVTLAIYSEIKANLELYEHRKYLDTFKGIVAKLGENEGATYTMKIEVSDDRFLVYKSQLENLGILDSDITVLVVRFYQLIEAIIQDIKPGGSFNTDEHGISSYEQLVELTEKAFMVGNKAVSLIESRYVNDKNNA